ncbi:MAG: helix-turn-helix domain-containing protein [Anaerolineales bacterium]|jgi:excisionase family DNA binding protein
MPDRQSEKIMVNEWLSLSEVAKILGVHPSTVRNWANQGQIPVHRTKGGHRRFKQSEVVLWQQTQQTNDSNEAQLVVKNALKLTRFHITEGHLQNENWYQKLDEDARIKYRLSGRNLMSGLLAYLSATGTEADAEARSLGYEYATRGRHYDLDILDATQAFLFFRNTLFEAMLAVYEAASINSSQAWSDMFRKVNSFTDKILTTLLETYQVFDRGDQR